MLMNRTKFIRTENLNSIIANNKANIGIEVARQNDPTCFAGATIEPNVQLNKVVLRAKAFGIKANRPFYAFSKRAGALTVLVDVNTGKTRLFDDSVIASATQVGEQFEIGGVIYGLKDTLNDQPRYRAVGRVEKPRAKARLKKDLMSLVDEIES